jgi:nicotinate-nucleotide--dimethylbenzimidazole phosphoribosyltransferase
MMLEAARAGIPVVVDGFVSSAAAAVALRLQPSMAAYLFFSHVSAETFHTDYLARESIRPVLDLDMRLGEGTGSVLAMQVIAQAMNCYHNMATFGSAGVSGRQE